MINLRLPNITGQGEREQLSQIKNYLYQMVEQLQWAFDNIGSSNTTIVQTTKSTVSAQNSTEKIDKEATFNAIKSLIIKSSDIVKAYYEEIDLLIKLSGDYVAQSDFGTYTETTYNTISANSESIIQHLSRIETIESDVEGINNAVRTQNSYIKTGAVGTTLDDTGLAANNAPGIEVGDHQILNDGAISETVKKYARFTAYGLELFGDSIDSPVAYIKQYKLYITNLSTINAEIKGLLTLGAFRIDTSKGFNLKYVGRG